MIMHPTGALFRQDMLPRLRSPWTSSGVCVGQSPLLLGAGLASPSSLIRRRMLPGEPPAPRHSPCDALCMAGVVLVCSLQSSQCRAGAAKHNLELTPLKPKRLYLWLHTLVPSIGSSTTLGCQHRMLLGKYTPR
ncbi:hypothetical protein M011DRAFT_115712 [Sporormia fimetaria CBS 119925]|uniref:Uncharacterized protein n=1 Tax=Sporormia fimetaria CBS 119925 TaxID=1340428 RepID=A0A6A6VP12_9PLEO|nr:hypothetical protein M011DRAFT_115712 [Sporormia fimetaria CBS 119925]